MSIRTEITLNPLTPEKEAHMKKYPSVKYRKPRKMIADVLSDTEHKAGNEEFRKGQKEEWEESERKLRNSRNRYKY